MVDLKAVENQHCSIVNYGTVGCTKDLTEKGKRLIIVDCITENGPVPGELWICPTESNAKQEKKYEFIETAADEEKAREMLHNQIQKNQTTEDFQTTSTKKRSKANSNEHLSLPKKTKFDGEATSDAQAETVEDEPGITYDFDYHDTINAETCEKYFEKVCQILKPRSRVLS